MTGKLLIMYGTETGNSEYLAMDAEKLASEHGMDVQVNAMDELSVDEISTYENVVIVCSTWGDGEQPDNAQELFDDFTDSPDGCMEGVNFAVLALGDSAFDMFCLINLLAKKTTRHDFKIGCLLLISRFHVSAQLNIVFSEITVAM